MARYEHLPVYKATYDLNLYFFKLSQNFPKDFKYGLGMEVRSLLTELLDLIIITNSTKNKCPVIEKAILTLERLKFKARLLHDLKVIRLKSYEFFFVSLTDLSKQLSKWYDYSKGKHSPDSKPS
jgi:hypothetical protein